MIRIGKSISKIVAAVLLTGSAALFFTACRNSEPTMQGGDEIFELKYAKGFTVRQLEGCIKVEIRNPWDTAALLQRYYLLKDGETLPSGLAAGAVIEVPVKRAAIYNSVHTSMFEELGCAEAIMGICEVRFILSPLLQEMISEGQIEDLGESTAPNIEKMIDKGADLLVTSPFENCGYGAAEKIGIPILEGSDYMESHPLARTEWIKLFGLLLGKEALADSIFCETEKRYNETKELAATAEKRPTMFSERRYGSTWAVPQKDSYMATMYRDAGAEYIFSDYEGTGSEQLTFEKVLDRAQHCEFWLLKYYGDKPMTYDELKAEYSPYGNFDAFKRKKIYTCNSATTDFYEKLPMHPDRMLKDLVKLFHPELIPDHEPIYYFPMAE